MNWVSILGAATLFVLPKNWALTLGQLTEQSGECEIDAPLIAMGGLRGTFSWVCETGAIQGRVLLSPTNPPAIQSMRLGAVPAE